MHRTPPTSARRLVSGPSTVSAMLGLVFGLANCSDGPQAPPEPSGVSGVAGSFDAGTAGANPAGGSGGSTSPAGAAGAASSGGAGTTSQGGGGGSGVASGSSGTAGTSAGGAGVGPAGAGGTADPAGNGGAAGTSGSSGIAGSFDVAGSSGAAGSLGVAGSSGAGGGGGADCVAGSVICDGFESYASGDTPGGPWSSTSRGEGAIVVDTSRAFSGKQSLHVTGSLNADRANISAPIQTESAVLHVRFMMYTVSYPASSGVHSRLARIGVASSANGAPDSAYSLATYNGTAIEKVNSIYLRDTGTKLNDSNLKGRWVCWEFGIDKSGGTGNVEVGLWVDGRQLTLSPAGSSSHGMTSTSWDPIPFDLFMLGLDGFQNDSLAADFWIDDLLITPERVGCPTT